MGRGTHRVTRRFRGYAEQLAVPADRLHAMPEGRPVIGQTYPLAHAQQAHAALDSCAVLGKTLLLT